jgi:3-hydroxyisobutyrate dehydrogenase
MRYGFIGLGSLGGHLAASLVRKRFDVTVNDLDRGLAARHLSAGGKWADSPEVLARDVDCIITCLPLPAISETVLATVLKNSERSVTSWIEMSTLGRPEILHLSAIAEKGGLRLLESPVTGGVHLAAQGKVTVLAGGDRDLFDLHRTALEAMGDKVFYMGPLGSAAIIKVITNMLAFVHLVADGEALMLAKRSGLDLAQAWRAIAASSGTSFVHETEGQLILNGSYDIAFTIDLALKDLGFAMSLGREFGVPLELAALTNQTFVRGKAAYGGSAQSTQIVKLLEDVLGTDLRAPGFPSHLA